MMKWLIGIPLLALGLGSCAPSQATRGDSIKVAPAAQQIDVGVQLLDVRTASEWKNGHLKGAKLVTYGEADFVEKARKAADPRKPVLVYCHSGTRTVGAAGELRAAGFSRVLEMEGGIRAWEDAGKPVEKGS